MNLVTFTVEEANLLIPELQRRMPRLLEAKRRYEAAQRRIDVLTLAVAGATRKNPDTVELAELRKRHDRLTEAMTREFNSIQRHGCLVKDVDQGLVDFYALAGDRLVFLCWKIGETEISHWHTLQGGYSQRKPLHIEPE